MSERCRNICFVKCYMSNIFELVNMYQYTHEFVIIVTSPPPTATAPSGPGLPHCRGFAITFRHTTFGTTPLDGRSARCRDLYLTAHNTRKRQTSMPPAGFDPAIPANERPNTDVLDRAATGISPIKVIRIIMFVTSDYKNSQPKFTILKNTNIELKIRHSRRILLPFTDTVLLRLSRQYSTSCTLVCILCKRFESFARNAVFTRI
jgi:hypothetical protein